MQIPLDDLPLSTIKRLRMTMLSPFSKRHRLRLSASAVPTEYGFLVKHVAMTPDRKILYVKNPKAACTTMSQLLHRYATGKHSEGDVHGSPNLLQGRRAARQIVEGLTSSKTFRLTTVRDPLRRALSAYHDFFVDKKNPSASRHFGNMTALGFAPEKSETFNFDVFLEYVRHNLQRSPMHCDRHWRPQSISIAADALNYGTIIRVEALAEGLAKVRERTGVDLRRGDSELKQRHNQSSASRRSDFRPSDSQRRKVRDLYEIDYKNFGY